MKKLKKVIAGLMSLTITAASMGAVSADAYGIIERPNSAFEYELSARIVSDTQIELKIDVTNNPGFYNLGFAVYYDGCTPVSSIVQPCYDMLNCNAMPVPALNEKAKNWTYIWTKLHDEGNGDGSFDYFGNFSLYYNFNVNNAYTDICKFSTAVILYSSDSENIDYSVSEFISAQYESTVLTNHDGIKYMVGDMDNNKIINMADASSVLSLVSHTENKQGISVQELNTLIERGPWLPSIFDWREAFPNMLCAEVADATGDGLITTKDSEEVLKFYSNNLSSIPYEGAVGSVDTKQIIVLV